MEDLREVFYRKNWGVGRGILRRDGQRKDFRAEWLSLVGNGGGLYMFPDPIMGRSYRDSKFLQGQEFWTSEYSGGSHFCRGDDIHPMTNMNPLKRNRSS